MIHIPAKYVVAVGLLLSSAVAIGGMPASHPSLPPTRPEPKRVAFTLGTPVPSGTIALPNMTTYIPSQLHAVVIAPVVQNGVWSVSGFGRIVPESAAVAAATQWGLSWGTMNGRPIIAAVRLVWANDPGTPMFGRQPLWLVTVEGLATPYSTNPASHFATALVIINARTGVWLQAGFVFGRPSGVTGIGTVIP
jgi:hypothetical protein